MYVCHGMYVCMHVYMSICSMCKVKNVGHCQFLDARKVCVCMYACVYVCMYLYQYVVCLKSRMCDTLSWKGIYACTCMCVCKYVVCLKSALVLNPPYTVIYACVCMYSESI